MRQEEEEAAARAREEEEKKKQDPMRVSHSENMMKDRDSAVIAKVTVTGSLPDIASSKEGVVGYGIAKAIEELDPQDDPNKASTQSASIQ